MDTSGGLEGVKGSINLKIIIMFEDRRKRVLEVLNSLTAQEKKRLKNSRKEYAFLDVYMSNAGCYRVRLIMTDHYERNEGLLRDGVSFALCTTTDRGLIENL